MGCKKSGQIGPQKKRPMATSCGHMACIFVLCFPARRCARLPARHCASFLQCISPCRRVWRGAGREGRRCRAGGQRATAWFLEMDLSTPGKLIQPSQLVLSGLGPLLPIPCLPAHTITTASTRTPTHSRMHAREHTRRAHPPAYSVYCIALFDGPSVLSTHMSAAF